MTKQMKVLVLLSVAAAAFVPRLPRAAPPRRCATARLALPQQSAKAREAALVGWLEQNGVHISSQAGWGRAAHPLRVESETVEDFELSGRGLLARKDVAAGEAVIRINMKLALTKEAARRSLGARVVPDSMGEYVAIATLLLSERAKGDASFWAPYIAVLPSAEEVGQTWVWAAEDLAGLKGSAVLDSTASLRAKLEREHAALMRDTVLPNQLDAEAFSLPSFLWAMSMLFSRAVNLREVQISPDFAHARTACAARGPAPASAGLLSLAPQSNPILAPKSSDSLPCNPPIRKVECLALVPYADLLNHSPYASRSRFTDDLGEFHL